MVPVKAVKAILPQRGQLKAASQGESAIWGLVRHSGLSESDDPESSLELEKHQMQALPRRSFLSAIALATADGDS
jgi:hypothetical protein